MQPLFVFNQKNHLSATLYKYNMNTYIPNKYTQAYFKIIKRARDRELLSYSERHHIIPRSIGGPDDDNNLVKLTAREHFVCHLLLPRMVSSSDKKVKLLHAMGMMTRRNNKQLRNLTSWEYARARRDHAEGNTLRQTGVKMTLSPSERKRRAESMRQVRKLRKYAPLTEEAKQNISNSKKGRPAHNKGKPATTFHCLHCGRDIAGASNFTRWHNSNCRAKC